MKILFVNIFIASIFISFFSVKHTIDIKEVKSYGGKEKDILKGITDFDYYSNKLYLFDADGKAVWVFNINGEVNNKIALSTGNGPGEINFTTQYIAVNDKYIILAGQDGKVMFYNNTDGKFINSVLLKTQIYSIFTKNNKLYVSTNDSENVLHIYDFSGNKIRGIITPFSYKDKRINAPHMLVMEGNENAFYIFNPYESEIMKWNNEKKWDVKYDKLNITQEPKIRERNGSIAYGFSKGWASSSIYNKYLIATSFDANGVEKPEDDSRSIVVLEKETGNLLIHKKVKDLLHIKSFENKYTFISCNEPYPHIKLVNLIIKQE